MSNFKGYVDEDNFKHGVEYEVVIDFKDEWSNDKIKEFISENLSGVELLEVKDSIAKLLWPLEAFSGEEEILMEMYYLLKQDELGTFEYTRVN